MIGTVNVRVSAAHPDVPLRGVPVFVGSACTVGVEGVPAYFGGVAVTGVSVGVENAAGEVRAVAAKRSGCMWVATFGSDFFAVPGSVRNGIRVTASGIEEDGSTQASWTLGAGDVCIIAADGVPVPGDVWTNVHLRDGVPEVPSKGDLAKIGAVWKVFDGVAWLALGGSSVVESATHPGNAAKADEADLAGSAANDLYGNPIVTVYAKKSDLLVRMDLVGDGTAASPYAVQLGGVTQTFAQVKALAESRNAVIAHGKGTYRITYIGVAEMMWDCTGAVQGEVQTGMIHLFASGNVVQLVPAKALALKSSIGAPVELSGEYEDGASFSFNFLTAGA